MKQLLLSSAFLLFSMAVMAQKSDSTSFFLVIDGEQATQEEFRKIQNDSTVIIHFLKGDRAIELYGPAARNGALITSRPDPSNKGVFFYGKTRISADSVDYSNISRIDVIRGRQAIDLYGPGGKDGVFILHENKPEFANIIIRITNNKGNPVGKATVKNKNGSILAKSDKCGWVILENFSLGNAVTISKGKSNLTNLVINRQVMNVKL